MPGKHALLLKGRVGVGSDKERPKGRVGSGSDNARGSTILNEQGINEKYNKLEEACNCISSCMMIMDQQIVNYQSGSVLFHNIFLWSKNIIQPTNLVLDLGFQN